MHLGSTTIHLTSVDSTNNYAAKLLEEGVLSSGTVILADEQTAGKGQRGAVWEAKPGENLLFSLVIRHVNMSVNEQFILNKIIGLALVDFLGKFGISSEIKWPNDVFVDGQKIAGVLIECSVSSSKINEVIIGIGLNVNQTDFDGLRATSMALKLASKVSIRTALEELLVPLNYWWDKWKGLSKDEIDQAYLNQLLGFNQWREFIIDEKQILGKIEGVDQWGRLLLLIEDQQRVFDLKEISYCW